MIQLKKDDGFTLVEMMATIVILTVVLSSLLLVFNKMTQAMQTTGAQAKALQNVTLISNQIAKDLRNLTQNTDLMKNDGPYHVVGIDGDGKYEDSTRQTHKKLTTTGDPNDLSDRLHLHANYTNSQLSNSMGSGSTDMATEVAYFAFWINGPSSPKTKSGLEERFGIVRRRVKHAREDLKNTNQYLPVMGSSDVSPVLDLNESNTSHKASSIVGVNIDYMSFQYYDPQANSGNGSWVNCWDTTGTRASCDYPKNGATASPRLPTAIRFSIRAYDSRANQDNVDQSELMQPIWYETGVSYK